MIDIRELTTMEEMEHVHELETKIWLTEIVPTHQTITAIKNGGLMLGAYDGEQLIGFSYGMAGYQNGRNYLCSHMLGLEEAYRSRGIGEMLKRKQREFAIEMGYDRMQWTFDPLETRNAYLNLTKLNGICNTYIENCYGELNDGLNIGLPTDRFEVHWHLTSPYVTENQVPTTENPYPINTLAWTKDHFPSFVLNNNIELIEKAYSLKVPKNFQELKTANKDLAMDWRLQTRKQFQRLFQEGFTAVRLQAYEKHAEYIFVRKDTLELGGK